MMWIQLMQPYVQKSSRTTFPRSDSSDKGAGTLSHATAPLNSGARIGDGSGSGPRSSATAWHPPGADGQIPQIPCGGVHRGVVRELFERERQAPRPVRLTDGGRRVDAIAPAARVLYWKEQQARSGAIRRLQHQ